MIDFLVYSSVNTIHWKRKWETELPPIRKS